MKPLLNYLLAGVLAALAGSAWAAEAPHIGYVYPAGGQQGSSFEVEIGGQYLSGATNVFINSQGVRFDIVKFGVKYEPRRLNQLFRNKENAIAAMEAMEGTEEKEGPEGKQGKERERLQKRIDLTNKQLQQALLPDGVDPMDKKAVRKYYSFDTKEQFNPQIADRLRVKVTIGKDAPPGEHELRIYTQGGLSNPIYFQVATLAETRETEPNDDHMSPELQTVPVPSIINGQIRPGDIDHFLFKANKGDSVVVDVGARRIIPYLADAVPGWFQAVVALYDEDGNEVAYQDDYKFNPDPVLFFDVPNPGTYTLSIRDSIYRGREDFIYRIAIGELPFITGIFPLGAQQGKAVDIALSGKNLPKTRLTGKLPETGFELRHVSVRKDGYRSNLMPFAIGEREEIFEVEPNNMTEEAQHIEQPLVVNGRIQRVGDRDLFSFSGREGDTVSIEIVARRLNSPLDSVITLTGPGMDEAVRNDDHVDKDKTHLHLGAGLVTHHADSYLLHTLPATGDYFIEVGDTQSKGGHDYGYRLRVSKSNPDFKLYMEPSGLHIGPGGTAAFSVRALRQDGFGGKIQLGAAQLPEGYEMSEAVIPDNSEMTRFTITAPREVQGGLVSPQITGTGTVAGKSVTHRAIAVDDQMQAFLYRHLVPAQELVLAPVSERPPLFFEARIPKSGYIEVPLGLYFRIPFSGRLMAKNKGLALKLDNPPEGLTLSKGWFTRRKDAGKKQDGKGRIDKNVASGNITILAEEPLKPGDQLSLVVVAEFRQGREKTLYPAPAIPVRIVE